MATVTARRRRAIEHLVSTDLARARLARAAFDAVADGLDLGPLALRSAADRGWVRVAIAGPIQDAADHALARLVDDLIETLSLGDPDLVARILGRAPDAARGEDPTDDGWRIVARSPVRTSSVRRDDRLLDGDRRAARAVPIDTSPTGGAVLR